MKKAELLIGFLCVLAANLSAFPYSVSDSSFNIHVEQELSRTFKSDLEAPGAGNMKRDYAKTRIWHDRAWQDGQLTVGGHYKYTDFGFSGPTQPIGIGKVWGFDVGVIQHIKGEWSLLTKINVDFAREKEADFADGFVFTGFFGASYQFAERLSVSFGLMYENQIEDNDIILPVVAVDWQITDQLRFWSANGAFLSYDLFGDGATVLQLNMVKYDAQQYILNQAANGESGLRHTVLSSGLSLKQYFMEHMYVSAYFDWLWHRKFKTQRGGTTTSRVEVSDGFSGGITAGIEF